jgi:hypothetical protein
LNEPRIAYRVTCRHRVATALVLCAFAPYPKAAPCVALYLATVAGSTPPANIIPSGLRSNRRPRNALAVALYPTTTTSNIAYTCVMLHSAPPRVIAAPRARRASVASARSSTTASARVAAPASPPSPDRASIVANTETSMTTARVRSRARRAVSRCVASLDRSSVTV